MGISFKATNLMVENRSVEGLNIHFIGEVECSEKVISRWKDAAY